jgi:hypothetical protein
MRAFRISVALAIIAATSWLMTHQALQKSEIEKWWPIIKAANIRGE